VRRNKNAANQPGSNRGKNMALEIFISHKMPTDTPVAEEIGSRLSLYAGNEVKVTHAGQFAYGVNWRKSIEEAINKTDGLFFSVQTRTKIGRSACMSADYFSRECKLVSKTSVS
jgi:hypothetical protein